MLTLFLLRHGETEFSRQDRFCGHIDAPLTAQGRLMADKIADSLGALPWRAIVTSTRTRTVATATPLATRAALPIRRDGRLDEMFYGHWQGLSKSEAAARDPERYLRWRQDPSIGAPGGESPQEVSARALAVVNELQARYTEGNVLLVSHKAVLRLLLCRLLGVELRHYRNLTDWPVAAVSVLDVGPEGINARLIADTSHLVDTGRDSEPQPSGDLVREQRPSLGEPELVVVGG